MRFKDFDSTKDKGIAWHLCEGLLEAEPARKIDGGQPGRNWNLNIPAANDNVPKKPG